MDKLVNNPDFTDAEQAEEKQEEGVKETESEELIPEVAPSPSETGVESTPELDKKEKELAGLENEKSKLAFDNTSLDQQIEDKRRQIVDMRRSRREKREELQQIVSSGAPDDELGILPEDAARLDKYFATKGFVRKEDLYEDKKKEAQEAFFESHPEYKAENDANDILYNALAKEVKLFATPSDPKLWKTILDKAHKSIQEQFPEKFPQKSSLGNQASGRDTLTATMSDKSSASTTPKKSSNLTAKQKEAYLAGGWTPEEVEGL